MIKKYILVATLAATGFSAPATAQVALQNEVYREVVKTTPDGKRAVTLTKAATVVPGSTMVYVMTFRNLGKALASKLVLNNKIPSNMEYIGPDGNTEPPLVSVNNGKTFGVLNSFAITEKSGAKRFARAEDVTNVRWLVKESLAAGAIGKVSYKARLK